MKLDPDESLLTGSWIIQDGKVRGDTICERIDWLLSQYLKKITDSNQHAGWKALYRDPADGRYWERVYPQSELHGSGPAQLRCLTPEAAAQKYGRLT
jgi:hypothetical protein